MSSSSWCTARVPATEPRIVHVDEALLVVDKPSGMLAVPGRGPDKQDCLSARLQARFADARVVHRLDMATSGLMLMARGLAAQQRLQQAFAQRQVDKRYRAIVQGMADTGLPPGQWARIDLPILLDWPQRPRRIVALQSGKPSLTHWRVIGRAGADGTLLELQPVTGRSHQLRVHLQAIGHPILGDALYGDADTLAAAPRLLLHATDLAFRHPATDAPMAFHSAPPFAAA